MQTINEILTEMEALEEEATPGPWAKLPIQEINHKGVLWLSNPDRLFCAASRTFVPRAVKALRYVAQLASEEIEINILHVHVIEKILEGKE